MFDIGRELTINNIFCFICVAGTASYFHMQLVRGKPVRLEPNSPFKVREVGSFIIITTPQGITLEWDRGTRVYVKLGSEQKGQVIICFFLYF